MSTIELLDSLSLLLEEDNEVFISEVEIYVTEQTFAEMKQHYFHGYKEVISAIAEIKRFSVIAN